MSNVLKVTPLAAFRPELVHIKSAKKPDRTKIFATLASGPDDIDLVISASWCVLPWAFEFPSVGTKKYAKLAMDAALADYRDGDAYSRLYAEKMEALREHLIQLVLSCDDIVDPDRVTTLYMQQTFSHVVKRSNHSVSN